MAKPGFSLNTNFKVCARIKHLDYSSRMLEVANDSVVTIRDINNKTNMEKQMFHFNKVFDQNMKQENVFSYVVDNAVGKALEGTNCCIMSYGQTGAGKSFTMFGDDEKISAGHTINMYSEQQKDKKGLIPKTIEFLLKRNKEMEGHRELILTCNFVEVYLDQVRDLSRNYSDRNTIGSTRKRSIGTGVTASTYETENLEIYEHPNGQMLIRDVKNVVIKSLDELYELLASGFALRDKSEAKGNQIWARAHTIFTINIVQKEVENEDLPFPKSMIQFVDLAGSERIAKSITEGQHKFQEAVLIMSHMTSLYKVLAAIASNSKNIPYRDSKLTKILYNCLTPYNSIIMIAHLHPAESNFEETLNTLQYAERCKNVDFKNKHAIGGNPSGLGGMDESGAFTGMSGNASNDKLWKKMTEEITDLKHKVEVTNRDYKTKLERIQTYLGIDIDLDKVTNNTASREYQVLNQLKNANLENQNLKVTIAQTEELFEVEAKEVEKERKDFLQKQQNMETKNTQLKDVMRKDTEKVKSEKNKDEETLKKKIQQLMDENKKLTEQNTQLLEDKTHGLMNFFTNLNSKTRDLNQNLDMKNIGKKEAELEFKTEVDQLKTEYQKVSNSLKEQYENCLKTKNEELERFTLKTQEYQSKQKEQIRGMESELEQLNSMFQKQEDTIERVENGGYSSGLKSFFIPTKDKCVLPTRQKFPCLYKILDTKKTEVTTKTLYRDKEKEAKETKEPKETKAVSQEDPAKKTVAPLMASKSQTKFTTTFGNIAHTGVSALSKVSEKPDTQEIDFGINIEKITEKDLMRYATNLQKLCRKLKDTEKELKSQADKFAELNAYGDIYEVIRERDRYKELYREETKKTNANKVQIETQKRMLKSSPSAGSTQTKFRPGTAGWH